MIHGVGDDLLGRVTRLGGLDVRALQGQLEPDGACLGTRW